MQRPRAPSPAVLVVDDDRAIASLLATFLSRAGLEVTVAHDLPAAARQLAAGDWAVLITDLQLGGPAGAEGWEVIALARRRCPGIRTILISGSAGVELADEALRRGADLYLPKPLDLQELGERVRSLLGLSS